jgi:hypothetical protein
MVQARPWQVFVWLCYCLSRGVSVVAHIVPIASGAPSRDPMLGHSIIVISFDSVTHVAGVSQDGGFADLAPINATDASVFACVK